MCTEGYKFTKLQVKMNHLVNKDDTKLYAENEKEMENMIQTIRVNS